MLIWDTNPRSPESFSPIGLRTAEKFQFLSVPDYNRLQTTDMNRKRPSKTIVRCDLPIATDKKSKKMNREKKKGKKKRKREKEKEKSEY
jgi:hypothetical protein